MSRCWVSVWRWSIHLHIAGFISCFDFSGSHYKALKRPSSVTAPLCDFHQPFGFLLRYVFESGKTDVLENMSKRTNFTSRKTHGTKTHCSICYTVHEKHWTLQTWDWPEVNSSTKDVWRFITTVYGEQSATTISISTPPTLLVSSSVLCKSPLL